MNQSYSDKYTSKKILQALTDLAYEHCLEHINFLKTIKQNEVNSMNNIDRFVSKYLKPNQ